MAKARLPRRLFPCFLISPQQALARMAGMAGVIHTSKEYLFFSTNCCMFAHNGVHVTYNTIHCTAFGLANFYGIAMQFEWDETKRETTLRERGIDFVDVVGIWEDPKRQERVDTRKPYGEKRVQTIGATVGRIFFVVYTERIYDGTEEVIRIISARRANEKERELYRNFRFANEAVI